MRDLLMLLSLCIAGCGTTHAVDIPQGPWECLTEEERQTALDQFKRQEEYNAEARIQAEQAKQEAEKTKKEAEQFAQKCRDEPSQCHVQTRQQWGL